MSGDFIERGAKAIYEADPVLDPPKFQHPIQWESLLPVTRQTSRAQFKAALAVVAEWLKARPGSLSNWDIRDAIRREIEGGTDAG